MENCKNIEIADYKALLPNGGRAEDVLSMEIASGSQRGDIFTILLAQFQVLFYAAKSNWLIHLILQFLRHTTKHHGSVQSDRLSNAVFLFYFRKDGNTVNLWMRDPRSMSGFSRSRPVFMIKIYLININE